MEFNADAPKHATGGDVTLHIDDRQIGKGRMDHAVPNRFSGYAGLDIGRDNGRVVDRTYEDQKPFVFVVGLFAPPLLAATAIGAALGAVGGKALHRRIGSGVEKTAEGSP